MPAYYNEVDAYASDWLENLIREGLIAPGIVDRRSIVDVRPADLDGFKQCHFFAGLGGWSGALRLAGVPDTEPLWTGSCPCQPFSLAGKQKGFADDRHLWPVWRELIRERSPAKVFGEQVASAAQWLGLVRSDLEAMGYAVGAMPVEAASAGADHLRDRFWFVGDRAGKRSGAGFREGNEIEHWNGAAGASCFGLADADDTRSQGRQLLPKCAGERAARADGVAHHDQPCASEGRQQRGGQFGGAGGDQEACACDVPDAASKQVGSAGQPRQHDGLEWVVGADGKARRVKSGIRLLAHGVPARVAKLRALGNAIDLRPAAQFIAASFEAMRPE